MQKENGHAASKTPAAFQRERAAMLPTAISFSGNILITGVAAVVQQAVDHENSAHRKAQARGGDANPGECSAW